MSAKFALEGSGKGAIDLIKKLNDTLDKTEEGFEGVAKGSSRAEQAAKRLLDNVATPMERYQQKVEKLAEAVKKEYITKEQATKAADRYYAVLQKTDPAMVAITKRQEAIQKELDNMPKSLRRVERGNEGAFGSKALAQMAAYGAGMLSVGAIIGGIKQGLVETERQAQQTADRLMNSLGSIGELQQVSSSPEDFQKNVAFARSLVSGGIVAPDDQSQAFDIAANLAGANFTDSEKALMFQVAKNRTVAPGGLAEFGGAMRKIQTLFGADEAGDLGLILDKVLVAGAISQAEATPTAIAMTKFAGKARKLGLSDEESFSALVTSENVAPNIDAAAERMKSFFASVDKRGLGSGSLANILGTIGARVQGGETVAEILGDSNAVDAYTDLTTQSALYDSSLAQFQNAKGRFAGSHFLPSDPRAAAADVKSQAEGALAMTMEEMHAEREALLDAVAADYKRLVGPNSWRAYGEYALSGFFDHMPGGDVGWMKGRLKQDEWAGRGTYMSAETRSRVEDFLERQALAAEQSAASLKNLEAKQSPTSTRQE